MASIQFTLSKVQPLLTRVVARHYSSSNTIKKSIFISQSNDIFTNLALEDWLYKNLDFTNHQVLMLWRNNPCVVIGRYQNPWLEANVADLPNVTEKGVQLARRNSGGGTVYHDRNNLNLTFFTKRDDYNRKNNLEVISRAIFREYGVKVNISPRQDLLIRNAKISGTAAKLGRPSAYHHCTLLVGVNKINLHNSLHKEDTAIQTNATRSVKSKILNLCEESPKITVDGLLSAVGWEFLRTPANTIKDGGKEHASLQNGFQMINPTEKWFPGISEIRNTLCDWEWCYGKTPKFTVTKSFCMPHQFISNFDSISNKLQVTMTVEHGRVSDVTLKVPPGLPVDNFGREVKVITNLRGQKFSEDIMDSLEWSLSKAEYGLVDDKDKFVTECVQQVMTSV